MKEENNNIHVGEVDIKITATDSNMKLVGEISKVSNKLASNVCEIIQEAVFYNTRIKRNGNSTTISFTDCIGPEISTKQLVARAKIMACTIHAVGDTIGSLQQIKHLEADYDGLLNAEKSANENNDSDNE